MQWLVPGVEFSAGCALIVGLLSALAAFGLFVICLFAFKLDAIIEDGPINRVDWIGDALPAEALTHRTAVCWPGRT